jgi:hypothetical protein
MAVAGQHKLSNYPQALRDAIRAHSNPVQAAYGGFDMWLEVVGNGFTSATGED